MNEPQQGVPEAGAHRLPVSKLRGVPQMARVRLKSLRITTCGKLLAAAATPAGRERLAAATGIDPDLLLQLVRRADLARINGIGTVFGLMLEALGVDNVARLAREDAASLHQALRSFNKEERLARRSPTPEEVAEWIEAARALPPCVAEEPVEGD
ncbi:MAG: DUF4332 domain-containing protein [Geminicoccaceae bacterium]|jgi:predicted flap endonuclease-1-like 5' DNA nuclease|nr:DUF4332 domain-containing protein [Geminicoccaceae bacterium]MCB9967340.1 DUF4332 domain-containing protein [Geminicoccaceae bacterium]HRY23189.1 DUF4332 domain-containing protein [Geminicoccaceae bacterium]